MDQEKFEKQYFPHIRDHLANGQLVLFTGAGFSLGAKQADSGEGLPSVRTLKQHLWDLCYGKGVPFEAAASLQDLFAEAVGTRTNLTGDLLRRLLNVAPRSLPDWYRPYFAYPWLRAYTLNVDNLADAAQVKFDLPRRVRARSATTDAFDIPTEPTEKQLELVHLNGDFEDIPRDITFSTTQYIERINKHDPWYVQLTTDLITRTVIFVGTSLDEPPLWQHLALRGPKGSRKYSELRHRSYLVSPTLSRPRQGLLDRFNVVWIPMDAEEFSTKVLARLTDAAETGFDVFRRNSARAARKQTIPLVADIATDLNEKTEFLMGQEPTWADIHMERAIDREVDAKLLKLVKGAMGSRSGTPVVVTGTAGSGKSTSLMRLALRLSAEGKRVGWLDRNSDLSPKEIVSQLKDSSRPAVLIIEEADNLRGALLPFINECAEQSPPPTLVLELRSNKVDRFIKPELMNGDKPTEVVIPNLSDSDIEDLLLILDRENRLGNLAGMTHPERVRTFRELCGRELVVAMYKATTGKNFRKKMIDEFSTLEGTSRDIYGLVSVASAHSFDLSFDEILIALGDRDNESLNAFQSLIKRNLLVRSPSDHQLYRVRHKMIAEQVFAHLRASGQALVLLEGLILASAAKVSVNTPRSERANRILRRFINHDLVYQMSTLEQSRGLYNDLENVLAWNFHYWLQRGALEVEWGNLGLAEHYLAQAKGLRPRDYFVRNEWAYLLFKRANFDPTDSEAPGLVKEAEDELLSLINDSNGGNPHSYAVLGNQGLKWAKYGIVDDTKRASYLEWLAEKLTQGVRRYPDNQHLVFSAEECRRTYLSIAARDKKQ